MSEPADVLLDEHVSRLFERVLRERGFHVDQAKDRFGERTTDVALLRWCGEHGFLLVTNNARDFELLHDRLTHAGLLVYYEQTLPDEDPEGLARAIEAVIAQYGRDGLADEVVDLEEWYEWLQE